MIPARTSGTKQRPMTAPARAVACASGDSVRRAGRDRVLDRLGHAGLADRGAVGPRIGAERAEQLLDVERDPVGPLVDRSRDVARRGQAGVEDQRRDESRLGWSSGVEADLLGDPLGDQARAPVPQARPGRHVLGPVVAVREERPVTRPAGQLGDDLEATSSAHCRSSKRGIVGPGERRQDQVDDLHDEAAAG